MPRIIGIDPGSIKTGFGIVQQDGKKLTYVTSGSIRIKADSLPEKLKVIHDNILTILQKYHPDTMAVEEVFMHKNAGSALKLGQARGAAVLTGAINNLPVYEYSPAEVKKAIVGKGNAAKDQVNHMVRVLLNLPAAPQEDAADALAIALCHIHTQETISRIPDTRPGRGGRLK